MCLLQIPRGCILLVSELEVYFHLLQLLKYLDLFFNSCFLFTMFSFISLFLPFIDQVFLLSFFHLLGWKVVHPSFISGYPCILKIITNKI